MSDRDRRLAELMGIKERRCFVCNGHLLPDERCVICNIVLHNPNFSSPEWRAKLMDWLVEHDVLRHLYWFVYHKDEWSKDETEFDGTEFLIYLWRNLPELVDEYRRVYG